MSVNVPVRAPKQWNAAWFENWVLYNHVPADARNAIGDGITVSTDGGTNAVTLTNEVSQSTIDSSIADHVAEADPHPGYLTQTEADALYEPTASILAVTTVTGLPTAVGKQGVRSMVTDANATTFMSIVAAGGSNIVPVISDGTSWRIG